MSGEGAPKKRRRWLWWVVLAVAIVAVAVIVLTTLTQSDNGASSYTTAQVEKTNLRVTISGSGNTVVGSAVRVDPGISGTVDDLSVKLGQTVKAGQLLFRLVNPDLDAAIERAEVSYKQAQQQVAQANVSVTQASNNLYNLQHPSAVGTAPPKTATAAEIKLAQQQLTAAKIGREVAYENRDSASTALRQARDDADKRTVTAPVGGMITVLNAQNGQALGAATSGGTSSGSGTSASSSSSGGGAVEISDMSTLRALVQINEVDLVSVRTSREASVQFDALPNVNVSGTVTAISPTGTNSSGVITYDVEITLKSIDPLLRPNMSCSAEILTATKPSALVVPSAAVKTASGKQYVEVFDIGATSPRQVTVTTGYVVGTRTEITSGLKEGEYVVTGSAAAGTGTSGGDRGPSGIGGMMRIGGGGR